MTSLGTTTTPKAPRAPVGLPPVDREPLRQRRRMRALQQVAAVLITIFMGAPIYLVAMSAFSSREMLNRFPKSFWPSDVSTQTIGTFLRSVGVGPAAFNSLLVGALTVVLTLIVGAPAGYSLARFAFRGRDSYQLFLLMTRALPIVVLSIPLAQLFLNVGVYDSVLAVVLVHTALALPTTILITASIFVSVPRDAEEAALVFGCGRVGAFWRIVAPLALPGLAASSIFTFVLSWNEILAASVLTLDNRTLPALVLSSLAESPLAYRFAGGFALVIPSLLFILLMRRYLLNMWGSALR